jgi:hypothetical protein
MVPAGDMGVPGRKSNSTISGRAATMPSAKRKYRKIVGNLFVLPDKRPGFRRDRFNLPGSLFEFGNPRFT